MSVRPRGAVEMPLARRRRAQAERKTLALGLVSIGLTGTVIGTEIARVWRRGSAPLPAETTDVLGAAEEAALQTIEVARVGYRRSTPAEATLVNMLASFSVTFGIVRASTHSIRTRGTFGPFRNLVVGSSHIHHFVPGIAMAFLAGGAGLLLHDEQLDPWLAVPFGVGAAMTLDESALLLKLDDVYWSEDGIVSVQITLTTLAMLSAAALALRLLRRGEEEVLDAVPAAATGHGAGTNGGGPG